MKCNEETCNEEATSKIVHMGSREVFYCDNHLGKYKNIMIAMGCPQPVVYPILEGDDAGSRM